MEKLMIRQTDSKDEPFLRECFKEKEILHWYPMESEAEIEDCVRVWMNLSEIKAGLTAEVDGNPAGMIILYIVPFKKFAHQCLFGIIVSRPYRGKGIGRKLIEEAKKLAKEKFKIEILHLEAYEENPAIALYEKTGFKQYGIERNFIKEGTKYFNKILMQQEL
jgi:ribosomal protein S18 acetylase RimI-like enzyme